VVRLVLFDIDGTLILTGAAGVKAFARVFQTEFNAVDGFENLKFAGRTDLSLVREFFSYHNIPATSENFERFFTKYVFWLDQILNESTTEICAGVREFIAAARALPTPPLIGFDVHHAAEPCPRRQHLNVQLPNPKRAELYRPIQDKPYHRKLVDVTERRRHRVRDEHYRQYRDQRRPFLPRYVTIMLLIRSGSLPL